MTDSDVGIVGVGLVTSLGLTAAASCAAIRSKLANPTETLFTSGGERLLGHQVDLSRPWRGTAKLAKMAALAIEEALDGIPVAEWFSIPLLLCTAERERPGQIDATDDELWAALRDELGTPFAPSSVLGALGRIGVARALSQACTLVRNHGVPQVLVAATDSLLTGPTLSHFDSADRLLTPHNSNGFMGGEGAGALLVSKLAGRSGLRLQGFGFAIEHAHIESEAPLRGDGLTSAIKVALAQAGEELHDMNYRISDLSGEQYYFKEASLALNRTLRKRKGEFELWHPAESIGETGATAGVACFAVGHFAALKGYAPGPRAILHFGSDQGARAAVVALAG